MAFDQEFRKAEETTMGKIQGKIKYSLMIVPFNNMQFFSFDQLHKNSLDAKNYWNLWTEAKEYLYEYNSIEDCWKFKKTEYPFENGFQFPSYRENERFEYFKEKRERAFDKNEMILNGESDDENLAIDDKFWYYLREEETKVDEVWNKYKVRTVLKFT
jgi:hypothetical protein